MKNSYHNLSIFLDNNKLKQTRMKTTYDLKYPDKFT